MGDEEYMLAPLKFPKSYNFRSTDDTHHTCAGYLEKEYLHPFSRDKLCFLNSYEKVEKSSTTKNV